MLSPDPKIGGGFSTYIFGVSISVFCADEQILDVKTHRIS